MGDLGLSLGRTIVTNGDFTIRLFPNNFGQYTAETTGTEIQDTGVDCRRYHKCLHVSKYPHSWSTGQFSWQYSVECQRNNFPPISFYQQDTDTVEHVQGKFTKRLPGLSNYSYAERLKPLGLHSLEQRRVYVDLIWCYKIVFDLVDLDCNEFFSLCQVLWLADTWTWIQTVKNFSRANIHMSFFSQRVISVWNSLPSHVDFCSHWLFKRSLGCVNFEDTLLGS